MRSILLSTLLLMGGAAFASGLQVSPVTLTLSPTQAADGLWLSNTGDNVVNAQVRVFRWTLTAEGEVNYLDARGERDIVLPPPFDFEWTRATKDMEVSVSNKNTVRK